MSALSFYDIRLTTHKMNYIDWDSLKGYHRQECTTLFVMAGCAGAGKTTLGKRLARELDLAFIDKDTVANDFTDFILGNDGSRESEYYVKEIRPLEYLSTFRLCHELLECGKSVVVAVPFISEIRDYDKWKDLACRTGLENVNTVFVWIEHDEEREYQNLIKRNAVRDQYKIKYWKEYCQAVASIEIDERYNVNIIKLR